MLTVGVRHGAAGWMKRARLCLARHHGVCPAPPAWKRGWRQDRGLGAALPFGGDQGIGRASHAIRQNLASVNPPARAEGTLISSRSRWTPTDLWRTYFGDLAYGSTGLHFAPSGEFEYPTDTLSRLRSRAERRLRCLGMLCPQKSASVGAAPTAKKCATTFQFRSNGYWQPE